MSRVRPDGVVVVTGASSGIGRATAHAFAEHGARVVLAARSAASLDEVAAECEARGGQALAVPTDVTDDDAVQELARRALERFGRIDVWVNDAGVMAYGHFTQIPADVWRHVVETNLLGQMSGARAALPQFQAQGSGVLICVASLYSKMTSPYVSPYVASKFGVLGFAEVLRQELLDSKNIAVCTILPGSVDTPIYAHAANYTGRAVRPVPPVLSPRRVAEAIVRAVEHPRNEITVGQAAHVMSWGHVLFPRLYNHLVRPAMQIGARRSNPAPVGDGAVFAPQPATNEVSGPWRQVRRRVLAKTALGLAAPGAAAAIMWRGLRR